jgi:hypothetical protein
MQTLKRATRAHEVFAAIDSTREYKSIPMMTRSLSAERLTLGAFDVQPAQVEITLCMGGNRDTKLTVSLESRDDASGTGSGSNSGSGVGPKPLGSPDQSTVLLDGTPEGHHAPHYTTSTRRPQAKVDVVITIGSKTFGHSVDSRVSVDMLQRIAGNEAQVTLEGYWVPIVVKGEGYIGCLCPHDEIMVYPGTQSDIDRINQARTTSAAHSLSKPKLVTASIFSNFLTRQSARDRRVSWEEFPGQLQLDKMVHVITDGCANPNPGPAGCCAVIRQN